MAGFQLPTRTFAEEDFEAILLADCPLFRSFVWTAGDPLRELPKDELLALVLEQAKRAGLVPAEVEVSQARRFVELCKADFRATRNYVLHRYPGRITLFKASRGACGTRPLTRRWAGANGLQEEWRSMSFRAITPIWFTSLTLKFWREAEDLPEPGAIGRGMVHRWSESSDRLMKVAQ